MEYDLQGQNKNLFGQRNFVAAGGKGSKHERALVETLEPDVEDSKQVDSTVEPVFFHALPEFCWAELLNACSAVSVIDLTASDEALPLACVKASISNVGFCMMEFHQEALWRGLIRSALWKGVP